MRSIDPTAAVHPGSRGRIGCPRDRFLVIGCTHQPSFRDVR
ncbi:MAG TPA: hypothetical protein VES39_09705 [Rhodospirillales bacterium]|nr:hypothetical protein [Rhodospirillales bacterium]